VLDALAKQVGVRSKFSDWPATTTLYASCRGSSEGLTEEATTL
jgi:glycerophosphoryl diester phosphodiesterase